MFCFPSLCLPTCDIKYYKHFIAVNKCHLYTYNELLIYWVDISYQIVAILLG